MDELLKAVNDTVRRIAHAGGGPPIFAFNPAPDLPPAEFTLAVEVATDVETGLTKFVRLGDFWLVPEILEKLKSLTLIPLRNAAPIMYALEEFSSDTPMTIEETPDQQR